MRKMDFSEALSCMDHPYPILFATVSGAHLYGFPSADSDYDLRGAHILKLEEVVGLKALKETITVSEIHKGIEVDLVTHDVKKFFSLLLNKNGYVLEQLYSPLVVFTTPEHEELKTIAQGCITRFHGHHYLGFSRTQWNLFQKENCNRIKALLYVYRVLLTGIHLMRTGEIQANLLELNEDFKLHHVEELVSMKLTGAEKAGLQSADIDFHHSEYERLFGVLENEMEHSRLPESPTAKDALNDLLVRIRTKST